MDTRYNIYFAGQILEGHDLAAVRAKLGKVFNADDQTLDKLFSGNTQLLKRECDRDTALKYKQAMENAGAQPIIKKADASDIQSAPPANAAAENTTAPQSAAEKIAAMAAAPVNDSYSNASSDASTAQTADTQAATETVASSGDSVSLAPPGSDVLRADERQQQASVDIDTSALVLDETGQRLSAEQATAPAAPDVTHLDMGEVGETIPNLPNATAPLSPNTDNLDLSPEGTDFSDCAPPAAATPDLDLSGMDVAPPGTEVLEEKYRNKDQPAPPPTDHLSLED